jgi:hypothetical protein
MMVKSTRYIQYFGSVVHLQWYQNTVAHLKGWSEGGWTTGRVSCGDHSHIWETSNCLFVGIKSFMGTGRLLKIVHETSCWQILCTFHSRQISGRSEYGWIHDFGPNSIRTTRQTGMDDRTQFIEQSGTVVQPRSCDFLPVSNTLFYNKFVITLSKSDPSLWNSSKQIHRTRLRRTNKCFVTSI